MSCIPLTCSFIVIPRSLSKSILSSSCSCISRCSTVFVASSNLSAKVLLPWSVKTRVNIKMRGVFYSFYQYGLLCKNFLFVLDRNQIFLAERIGRSYNLGYMYSYLCGRTPEKILILKKRRTIWKKGKRKDGYHELNIASSYMHCLHE